MSSVSQNANLLRQIEHLVARHAFRQDMARPAFPAAFAENTARHEFDRLISSGLRSPGVSHLERFTPDQVRYYEAAAIYALTGSLRGLRRRRFRPAGQISYAGIGIRTCNVEGRDHVRDVYAGGPADHAGLRPGDEICAVARQPFHEINSFLELQGVSIEIAVRRQKSGPVHTVPVVPVLIEPLAMFQNAVRHSAAVKQIGSTRVGYIRMWCYAGAAFHELLKCELFEGKLKSCDALVLDLRGGWGGASIEFADLFSRHRCTLEFVERRGKRITPQVSWNQPTVVLVDKRTRSGKELLAYALQRYGALLVGERTAGQVLGAKAGALADDSILLIPVADVLVDGLRLEGIGVTPDVTVNASIPYSGGVDAQRDRALYEATRLV